MQQRSGIVLLDKQQGITSMKAITEVRRALGVDRIGHTGTLDPMATGLLVCLIGKATKLAPLFEAGRKTYTGTIQFGLTTHTDDLQGDILTRSEKLPTFGEVLSIKEKFVGAIQQVPPKVSAVKVKGVRAYRKVFRGEDVVLAPREVTVYSFDLEPKGEGIVQFKIECSKGTYIRSIARDMGEMLGCGGALESLRRTRSEPFSIVDARMVYELTESDILNPESVLPAILNRTPPPISSPVSVDGSSRQPSLP